MAKKNKLYIDSEGVQRGYYVYVHKDVTTDSVFYVGKGHGDRAWKKTGRNSLWQEHAKSLDGDWHVEIVHDDLSEIEAFEMEAELVGKFGGPAALGGSLKNWVPGGEEPASIAIEIPLGELGESLNEHFEIYAKARKFKQLQPKDRIQLAESTFAEFDSLLEELTKISLRADSVSDEFLVESLDTAQDLLYELADVCRQLKSRRISWNNFCLDFEDHLEQLEFEMEDTDALHPEAVALMKRGSLAGRKAFRHFDSGNKSEAERIAKQSTERL